MIYQIFDEQNQLSDTEKKQVATFLYTHLDAYGDPLADIEKAMDYALSVAGRPGGFVLVAREGDKIVSAVVVNKTGMSSYIPDNILVYIATHQQERGKGIGKAVMEKAIERAEGDIALHVEAENPAKRLYEKLGFTNKYLEMRLKKGA